VKTRKAVVTPSPMMKEEKSRSVVGDGSRPDAPPKREGAEEKPAATGATQ
jgi:hypothetical protein